MKKIKKQLNKKINNFSELCGDWDYRNIDMTRPHLSTIDIQDNNLVAYFEIYSPFVDEYIFSSGVLIEDNELTSQFKKLNLKKKNEVLKFIERLDSLVEWDVISNDLSSQEDEMIERLKRNEKKEEMSL